MVDIIRNIKLFFNIVATVSGLIAAFLWFQSTRVKIPYRDTKDFSSASIVLDDGTEIIETARQQSKWSKRAACAAATSALCQSVILLLPSE